MIQKIKEDLKGKKNKYIKIKVDVGRNKYEEYEGYVDELYENIWTFKTSSDIKSFSYKDILIKSVILSPL
ncbi:MAG: Veg family protein [Tenericutes bacterium]|nr:Veg family protein [Mycoplasmatota bacterium]